MGIFDGLKDAQEAAKLAKEMLTELKGGQAKLKVEVAGVPVLISWVPVVVTHQAGEPKP